MWSRRFAGRRLGIQGVHLDSSPRWSQAPQVRAQATRGLPLRGPAASPRLPLVRWPAGYKWRVPRTRSSSSMTCSNGSGRHLTYTERVIIKETAQQRLRGSDVQCEHEGRGAWGECVRRGSRGQRLRRGAHPTPSPGQHPPLSVVTSLGAHQISLVKSLYRV